jgi:uncharacterized membrane protein YidH (DUF202 family)
MLQDVPLRILTLLLFIIVIIGILTFSTGAKNILSTSQTVAVKASLTVEAVLVIPLFVVESGTVVWAAV